jgi:hypothetical protein
MIDLYFRFTDTAPNVIVSSLQRVQNTRLWKWYFLKKNDIATISGTHNEKMLFHGSNVDNIKIIIKEGLDMRVANMGGAIGAGLLIILSLKDGLRFAVSSPILYLELSA